MTDEPALRRRDFLRMGAALGIGTILAQTGTAEAVTKKNAGSDITHGSRKRQEVALTFHGAGNNAYAKSILKAVADAKAGITVFAVGTWLKATPEMARAILNAGHDLGNHTMTHPVLTRLSPVQVAHEIDECAALLKKLTGSNGEWFRPSGTSRSNATIRTAAHRAGYQNCITYDIDSLDYTDQSPAATVKAVTESIKPGSIVSLHFGHAHTVKAVPLILADLASRGLKPVTLTHLLRK